MKRIVVDFGKKFLTMSGKMLPKFNAKFLFLMRTHKWPNLRNPRTFNEKTTWLKLNDYNNNSLVSKCADKYLVREYVESKGCGDILNELYGVYDSFEEIDFSKLPKKFVLKCVHGCAYNIIVKDKDKLDTKIARKKIRKWQKEQYGYATTELHYTKIRPRIIAEKYLCDKNGKMPVDYKFYCMDGKVECVLVCSERDNNLRLSYYDRDWQRLPYEKESWSSKKDIKKPKNLNKMIECAEKLSGDFPFVRVDLYNDNGKIIFGEMTFTPACSCAPYYSKYGSEKLGEILHLGRDTIKFKVQNIVATVNNNGEKLYKKMNLRCDAVIANQNTKDESITIKNIDGKEIKIINTKSVGVGRNRNIGLVFADADICIMTDDDMLYEDDYVAKVVNTFNRIKDADVVIFDIVLRNSHMKTCSIRKEKRVGYLNYMKYGCSRLAFKRQSIKNNNIFFSELFGGGSKYSSGEDTIFIRDCLKCGLHVYMVPVMIAIVDCKNSSWYSGANEKFFYDKGALLCAASTFFCFPMLFYFAKKFGSNIGYCQKVKLLFAGINGYRLRRSYEEYTLSKRGN